VRTRGTPLALARSVATVEKVAGRTSTVSDSDLLPGCVTAMRSNIGSTNQPTNILIGLSGKQHRLRNLLAPLSNELHDRPSIEPVG
jgi:hypothetical protein